MSEQRVHRKIGQTDDERRAQQREYNRKYRATEKSREARRREKLNLVRDYQKHGAHRRVQRALASGRIVKEPCFCGNAQAVAHHYLGYAIEHRLDIVWLCRIHHAEAHRQIAAAER